MKFAGLTQPPVDEPLIELESTVGLVVDLYNEYDLHSTVIRAGTLEFDFGYAFGSGSTGSHVTVLFLDVRRLRITQPSDWVEEGADQIEHLLVRRPGPWPRIVFHAGGMKYEFDCAEVRLVVQAGQSMLQHLS